MSSTEPPPPPPATKASLAYKYQLVNPKGTVLAKCSTRQAAIKTATAAHGPLHLKRDTDDWELYDDLGVLVGIVMTTK